MKKFITMILLSISLSLVNLTVLAASQPAGTFVFSGGGVKGIAYVGALKAYEDITQTKINSVKNVVGTSAGSITAMLVALGFTTEEVKNIVWSIDFAKFEDGNGKLLNSACLLTVYGWYRGDVLYQFLRQLVEQKLGDPDATFADLMAKTGTHFTVFVTNLSTNSAQAFSSTDSKTKNIPVAYAVRASASIPMFFDAMFFKEDSSGNLTAAPYTQGNVCTADDGTTAFVDGGIMNNYPINYALKNSTAADDSAQVLGFILLSKAEIQWFMNGTPVYNKSNAVPPDKLMQYLMQLVDSVTTPQYDQFVKNKEVLNKSVLIDDLGVSTTDFTLSDKQKQALVESGYTATWEYYGKPALPLQKTFEKLLQPPKKNNELFQLLDKTVIQVNETRADYGQEAATSEN